MSNASSLLSLLLLHSQLGALQEKCQHGDVHHLQNKVRWTIVAHGPKRSVAVRLPKRVTLVRRPLEVLHDEVAALAPDGGAHRHQVALERAK
eukprot:5909204-Prymnesium_polylepis.1